MKQIIAFLLLFNCHAIAEAKHYGKNVSFSEIRKTFISKSINNFHLSNLTSLSIIQKSADSTKVQFLKKKIKKSYKKKQWNVFHQSRLAQIKLTKELKDSSNLAKTFEYSGAYFRNHTQVDSAYYYFYKSYKIYDHLKDSSKAGRILVNLAILQKNTRDYKGSEQTSFKAIRYLTPSENSRRIASMYNNLAVVYNELGDIVSAIKYHKKSLEYRETLKNKLYLVYSLNNIGKLYKDNGEYGQAITYFKKALSYTKILYSYPLVKATIDDNYTHTLFKTGQKEGIIEASLKTLAVREKENDKNGIIINCIHLAEYFDVFGNRKKAIEFAERAEKVSLEIKNFRDYLVSLELISNMYKSPKAQEHFKKYILVRDSIEKVARSHKNQFDRIRFETEEKNNRIKEQSIEIDRKRTTIYSIIIILGCTFLVVLFLYRKKQLRENKLQKQLLLGFEQYLKEKYDLTNQNIEFWNIWTNDHGQEYIAEKLYITVDAVKSRRRSLKNKISKIEPIDGAFDRAKAIILFNKEFLFYKKKFQKKS